MKVTLDTINQTSQSSNWCKKKVIANDLKTELLKSMVPYFILKKYNSKIR